MASITLTDIVKKYGDGYPAVNGVSLDIKDGEFVILVGPSGCGKSTLLRMIVGLEDITSGELKIGDEVVNEKAPRDRHLAMVFQNYALYPHLTVYENIAFPLRLQKGKYTEEQIKDNVEYAADTLELREHLDRKPANLSGGQRQRVAMGRAIVRQPRVFLMDEPLSNLDAKLRVQTRTQIASLQRRLGVTTVYVTHDQTEALTMGDRIAVLKDGLLQQVGTPRDMYDTPANVFVAGFIGSPAMNIGTFPITDGVAKVGSAGIAVPRDVLGTLASDDNNSITIGFRPEALDVVPQGTPDSIPVSVNIVEELGSDAFVYGSLVGEAGAADVHSGAGDSQVIVRVDPRQVPAKGETIHVRIRTGEQHLFHAGSGERIAH
jgi:multiple sugar transport system ATP-binding protein